jgi:hypothetical protein
VTAERKDFWENSHERYSINAGKLVFLGFAALRQISADGSIIVFKIVQFWTETPAESVYVKSGGAGPQSQRRGRSVIKELRRSGFDMNKRSIAAKTITPNNVSYRQPAYVVRVQQRLGGLK